MDQSNRKPPSPVGFRITMVVVVLLIAVVLWFGIPAVADLLGPGLSHLFSR